MKIILIISSILLATVTCQEQAAKPSKAACQRLLISSDQCVTKTLLLSDRNVIVPRTLNDVEDICRSNKENIDCIKKYGNCLQLFPKQIFNMIMRSLGGLYKDVCSGNGKKELLKHMQCFKDLPSDQMTQVVDMFHKLTAMLNHVSKGSNSRQMIPGACCAYIKSIEDAKNVLETICGSHPGTPAYLLKMFKQASKDIMDLSCARYSTIEKCQKSFPSTLRRFDDLIKNVSPQPTGFFVPLMSIGKKLTVTDVL